MTRRSRLSRSRDFDAVYRNGRSVATRYLVLYTFKPPADDDSRPDGARVGLAVPRQVGDAVARNQIKRRLRAAFDELGDRLDVARDYVLIARPGLAEAAESKGFDWLVTSVGDAVLQAEATES